MLGSATVYPILGLYAGRARAIPGDGRPSAIFKQAIAGPVQIGPLGLIGDEQADLRVHGGSDKAVHHFPLDNHRRLARQFPELAAQFVSGAIGENVSTDGLDESGACIGDVYALGSARVQLVQPRSPCWKIDAKFGREGITRHIAEQGIAGWYYRVLAPGTAAAGEALKLLERNAEPFSVAEFWRLVHAHRPGREDMLRLAGTPGLSEGWRKRFLERAGWLRDNPSA
jgi:MOSC domain-containing protein YiiM